MLSGIIDVCCVNEDIYIFLQTMEIKAVSFLPVSGVIPLYMKSSMLEGAARLCLHNRNIFFHKHVRKRFGVKDLSKLQMKLVQAGCEDLAKEIDEIVNEVEKKVAVQVEDGSTDSSRSRTGSVISTRSEESVKTNEDLPAVSVKKDEDSSSLTSHESVKTNEDTISGNQVKSVNLVEASDSKSVKKNGNAAISGTSENSAAPDCSDDIERAENIRTEADPLTEGVNMETDMNNRVLGAEAEFDATTEKKPDKKKDLICTPKVNKGANVLENIENGGYVNKKDGTKENVVEGAIVRGENDSEGLKVIKGSVDQLADDGKESGDHNEEMETHNQNIEVEEILDNEENVRLHNTMDERFENGDFFGMVTEKHGILDSQRTGEDVVNDDPNGTKEHLKTYTDNNSEKTVNDQTPSIRIETVSTNRVNGNSYEYNNGNINQDHVRAIELSKQSLTESLGGESNANFEGSNSMETGSEKQISNRVTQSDTRLSLKNQLTPNQSESSLVVMLTENDQSEVFAADDDLGSLPEMGLKPRRTSVASLSSLSSADVPFEQFTNPGTLHNSNMIINQNKTKLKANHILKLSFSQ